VAPSFSITHASSRELYGEPDAAKQLAGRLKTIDRNNFLNQSIFCEDGFQELSGLIAEFGLARCEMETRDTLAELGSNLRRGQINTWAFLVKRLRREYADLPDMVAAG
jgi:hypothetical protein